jgi:hypothetical protein
MTDSTLRSTLTEVLGTVELAVARLSRAEHGDQRATVAGVRGDLKTVAAALLALRAKLFDGPTKHPAMR